MKVTGVTLAREGQTQGPCPVTTFEGPKSESSYRCAHQGWWGCDFRAGLSDIRAVWARCVPYTSIPPSPLNSCASTFLIAHVSLYSLHRATAEHRLSGGGGQDMAEAMPQTTPYSTHILAKDCATD